MNRPRPADYSMTNRQSILSQTNPSSAATIDHEDRLRQQRHPPRNRVGASQHSPPELKVIMNPEDVCYDYQRAAPWHEPNPYVPSNPYHQLPHAYRATTQLPLHQQQQTGGSREFLDLSQMMGKYESPELARGSSSYPRDPGHIVTDQWTRSDVDGYTLPSDTAALWQSYYPASTYDTVPRQLGSAGIQLTPSSGYQTFYKHEQHASSISTDSDPVLRHSLSGHLHDAPGSRRSSTDESRASMIQPGSYHLAAHSTPFPVLRPPPSQADYPGLHGSPPDAHNRLQVLLDTQGGSHMHSYRHGMMNQEDTAALHSASIATSQRISGSDVLHRNLHHVLVDDSSASTSSSQRHPLVNDVRPKVTPSTSIGKTRTREKYRTVYTEQQKVELEQEYVKGTFISAQRKSDIAKEVGLSERQVKIWFQNRRAKDRKTRRKTEDNCVSTSQGLTSAINQVHSSVHSSDAESLPDSMTSSVYGGQRVYDFHRQIQQH